MVRFGATEIDPFSLLPSTLMWVISRWNFFVTWYQRPVRCTSFLAVAHNQNFLALCASNYYDNNLIHR